MDKLFQSFAPIRGKLLRAVLSVFIGARPWLNRRFYGITITRKNRLVAPIRLLRVICAAVAGGGMLVKTFQVPPTSRLLVNIVLVRPMTGVKVSWNFPPLIAGAVGAKAEGSGLVTTRLAMELVTLPALLVITTV